MADVDVSEGQFWEVDVLSVSLQYLKLSWVIRMYTYSQNYGVYLSNMVLPEFLTMEWGTVSYTVASIKDVCN